MHKQRPSRTWSVIAVLALTALACGLSVNLDSTAVPTQAPFQLPTGIPAAVSSPTAPPEASVQAPSVPFQPPESTATQANVQATADLPNYYMKGYLPYQVDQLQTLDDFSKTGSTLHVVDLTRARLQVQDFEVWADIELKTTGSTPTYPNYTGCGFAYRVQNNSEGYTAVLTNEAVRMGACNSGMTQCTLFGTTYGFGTGDVSVPNGSKARFSLAASRDHAWVLVDGVLVGQYSLYTTKLLGMGDLYYAAVSNINAGYSTSCKISNVSVWESQP